MGLKENYDPTKWLRWDQKGILIFCGPIRIKNNKKTEPSDTKRNRMIETQAEEQFSSQN